MKTAFSQRVSINDDGRRLDRLLRLMLKDMPLSTLHKALRKGDIRVNGQKRSPDYRCREGDTIEYGPTVAPPSNLAGRDLPTKKSAEPEGQGSLESGLSIILETSDLLFLDKPAGLLVHDGPDSLDARVRRYLSGRLEASLAFTPGPLHRLDRNTSGLIAFSRSLSGAVAFSAELRRGSIRKTYLAILEGCLEKDECWEDSLSRDTYLRRSFVDSARGSLEKPGPGESGKKAITEVFPIASNGTITLAAIRLLTGRTHQIRAQGSHHGHPLAGDVKYGGSHDRLPYYLHAWKMAFAPPSFPDLPRELSAPFPPDFDKKILSSFSNPEKEVYSVLRKFRFQEGT